MPIDFTSPAWLAVAQWAHAEIDRLRTTNDGELDPVQTATLRGQLRTLKKLLGLPEGVARAKSAESVQQSPFGGDWGEIPNGPDWR